MANIINISHALISYDHVFLEDQAYPDEYIPESIQKVALTKRDP
ncbi:MAG TPA: hypothetical protein P5280_08160 [Cyclobacteriaceae bacterium]|nr:hypothetical protein [Cyclobacteriaceae bacterium]